MENFIEKVKNILKDKEKRKKIIVGIVIISVIYLILSYFGINYTMSKIHTNLKVDKVRKRHVNLIIIVTVNPKENKTTMISVPRDTYTKIARKNRTTKINEAYSYGGAATVINTIQKKFGIPIDFYAEVNMKGLQDVVDALGGVTVKSPLKFSNYGYSFRKGRNSLNGKEALAYATMRYEDPTGDYGRQGRQRQIIDALIDKVVSFRVITNQMGLLKSVEKNIKTSLTFEDIVTIQKKNNLALRNIEQIQIKGDGQMIGGVSYQVISKSEIGRISEILKKELHFKKKYK